MPPTVWQCEGMLRWQYSHRPHLVMAGTSTRSPTLKPLTASPTAVTVPTASWPRMRPSVTAGDVTVQDVQVGAADRGGVDLDHDVGGFLDRGVGDVFPRLLARSVVYEGFH